MICPYCNNKMQKGYINSTFALARWYADGEKLKMDPQNSGIRLSDDPATKKQIIESYHCSECRKIVINLS